MSGNLIVTYHYVRPYNSEGVTGITPEELDEQITLIKERYEVIPVDDFLRLTSSVNDRPLALLTFDDGLRDQYEYAFPVLDRHGVKAVFFVPMKPYCGEAGRWCTQHLLHALADAMGWRELENAVEPLIGVRVESNDEAMNLMYHYELPQKRMLKYALAFRVGPEWAAEVLGTVNRKMCLEPEDWYMTTDQLRHLQNAGYSLGGHGFGHTSYTSLSPQGQREDMLHATTMIRDAFGDDIRTMAYPFGQHTKETEAIAKELGYTHCFGTEERTDAKFLREKLKAVKRADD